MFELKLNNSEKKKKKIYVPEKSEDRRKPIKPIKSANLSL